MSSLLVVLAVLVGLSVVAVSFVVCESLEAGAVSVCSGKVVEEEISDKRYIFG